MYLIVLEQNTADGYLEQEYHLTDTEEKASVILNELGTKIEEKSTQVFERRDDFFDSDIATIFIRELEIE